VASAVGVCVNECVLDGTEVAVRVDVAVGVHDGDRAAVRLLVGVAEGVRVDTNVTDRERVGVRVPEAGGDGVSDTVGTQEELRVTDTVDIESEGNVQVLEAERVDVGVIVGPLPVSEPEAGDWV